ncbi:hypothetical protein HAX54_020485 [Datura stramonium]|uniref:Uncharacterized protein n=1 Tax=Datura stramonium TaxID=4076 RepID=A0ABS8S506_DATST|nr:hypothetical protein [Datura stramonium]
MGTKIREFNVKVINSEVVVAMLLMQEHWLPQSNLDFLLPPVDVGVYFCYEKPIKLYWTFGSMVRLLKVSLAETLVSYYAFAGELVQYLAGEPQIFCNNAGVHFTEALTDVELKEIHFNNPDESIEGKLVPKKKHGVLAVQISEPKCGGVVVGCIFDHRIAEAYSANMFLVSWAELAQSEPLSQLPSFLFPRLRRPSYYYDPLIDSMYLPISALKQETTNINQVILSRISYVKAEEINHLQSLANFNKTNFTKLVSFSAFLWKIIASAGTTEISNNTINNKKFKLGIVVNGRTRLSNGDENQTKLLKGEIRICDVMPMPSPKGNGDWIVYMHMLKGQVDLVEAIASNVFKPITAEYLNLK